MDISHTIAPKSDQINYDDFLAGPRTITVTRVAASDTPEQPVSVYFEGDNGKPWRPCKSMRRVLIAAWGADATKFTGRSLTLYGDPEVSFGGMKVGGIRISHMSGLDAPLKLALTATKAKRAVYTVQPIKAPAAPPTLSEADAIAQLQQADTLDALGKTWAGIYRQHRATADIAAVVAAKDARKSELTPPEPANEEDEIPL